jgi:hypothetical protein
MNLPKRGMSVLTGYKLICLSTPIMDPSKRTNSSGASLDLDTEPVDDNESVDAARDETVPKFASVVIYNHAANERVDGSANLNNEAAGRERVC